MVVGVGMVCSFKFGDLKIQALKRGGLTLAMGSRGQPWRFFSAYFYFTELEGVSMPGGSGFGVCGLRGWGA